jgi:hypothetical protein
MVTDQSRHLAPTCPYSPAHRSSPPFGRFVWPTNALPDAVERITGRDLSSMDERVSLYIALRGGATLEPSP